MKINGKRVAPGALVTAVALLTLTACPGGTADPNQETSPGSVPTVKDNVLRDPSQAPVDSGKDAGNSSEESVDDQPSGADDSDLIPAADNDPSTETGGAPSSPPTPTKTSSVERLAPAPGGPIPVPLPNLPNATPPKSSDR